MWYVLGFLAGFLTVLIVRALLFKPYPQRPISDAPAEFDADGAVNALQKLVQCKTISYNDPALENEAEFQKLIDLLPGLYPKVFEVCAFQQLPDRALLFRWQGRSAQNPSVMMAHYDVVPVREELWEKPPFAGIIEHGVLWGRGTLDTKVTFNGVLFSANTLMEQGFVPENDIYFAFSGGEEVNGPGAKNIVDWFVQKGITPALVVDEGGAVVENVFPGVKVQRYGGHRGKGYDECALHGALLRRSRLRPSAQDPHHHLGKRLPPCGGASLQNAHQ